MTADSITSSPGWAAGILFHDSVKLQFQRFYDRKDTFSFGVCNGCQLMALLGWVGADNSTISGENAVRVICLFLYYWSTEPGSTSSEDCEKTKPDVFMAGNDSGRYESRFSTVRIDDSPALMLRGMSGSTLGVWVAHGEGQYTRSPPLHIPPLCCFLSLPPTSPICSSVYLSICSSVYLSICPSVYLYVCSCVYLSVCSSVCLSRLSTRPL